MTKDDRAARLAAQLRANLKRRKAQAREGEVSTDQASAGDEAAIRAGDDGPDDQRRTSDPAA